MAKPLDSDAAARRHAVERLRRHAQGYEAKGRDDLAAELRRIAASMEKATPGR